MNNIIIKGAREGNLNGISLEIPRNKIVVFTGLSGSGKSTLAIDTLFKECQRQYLEVMGMQGKDACKTCQGLGMVLKIKEDNVIHEHLSLEAGAVDFWEQRGKRGDG